MKKESQDIQDICRVVCDKVIAYRQLEAEIVRNVKGYEVEIVYEITNELSPTSDALLGAVSRDFAEAIRANYPPYTNFRSGNNYLMNRLFTMTSFINYTYPLFIDYFKKSAKRFKLQRNSKQVHIKMVIP